MRAGAQKRLPANTQVRRGCLLAGVIDGLTAQVWCQPIPKLTSECLIRFFEGLLVEVFPTEKLVIVMDNASAHRSQTMQAFLSLFQQRVMVIWLPPYSPDMNASERFWKHLKQRVTANHLFANLHAMLLALQAEMASQNALDYEFRFSYSNF